MNRTTISISLYNHKDYIKEAIDSALAQTVPCDIIVVDDGSTDGSRFTLQDYIVPEAGTKTEAGTILDDYGGKIKVIHQVNKGLSSARNTGLMNATTEFFLPLDSDDILLPNAVERMEKVFDDVPDAGIVSPSFTMFGVSQGDVILMMRPSLDDFKAGNRIGYCSMFRRKDLLECGGYSPRMTFGYEDLHLSIDLLRRGKNIYTIPEPLWMYRTKENSMINVAQAHHAELMAQIKTDHGF